MHLTKQLLLCVSLLTTLFLSPLAKADGVPAILSMKERAAFIDNITELRVNTLMPSLMKQHNIDMWLLISREYNEDPILKTMLPATWLSARRTTILLFALNEQGNVDAYAIAPYKIGNVFTKGWDKKAQPNQWQALNDIIERYKPSNIALNTSTDWGHADGLVLGDYNTLMANLPSAYKNKIISAEPLAVAWLEQRIPQEIDMYKHIVAIAHAIIAEGFSSKVITVGKTTSDDLVWWFRERVKELKLQTWFHPSIAIQRADSQSFDHEDSFTNGYADNVIQAGDLLHVDFGITYLRLNTDTQQHAYVLKPGETDAPAYLVDALKKGNKLQDIFTSEFSEGKTGNQVLKAAREKAIAQGLKPTIYTHPLGYHGHAAGTTLGMWDSQQGVPGDGDYPLHLNTAYSIELNNAVFIKPWNKEIRIMLEEDAIFDKTGVWYLNGRQTELLLVK
ncbi:MULTISPECIES: M24 family metallopeptidase [unclassified Pseudoalteromonas]|uniref:M24 family metallopeptidase n=1 Tax=unclassified Pseudoalteromonas TaxID=194690 RepID=UPI001107BF6F|nr:MULTISPECIES: M24 family metallopeptidase [unclassified Pseudoalteromonas]TMN83660.1 Xaa-Pro aminopeptidase [Pseudoalteromonas sp. S410]TMN91598.1 Xaa-Pro aminopeptidase [Pseudoalteromonas sp. S408]TMN96008.1 Xaa-Pro aminopeptidase [Pseudoalteromonas sp. S407]TMO02589.1 Xaa-Pro aminopeptidase [Pseudoalteromonas sp. S409]TMO12815.1 Xaa-Pro aminopeptidase [Pseudoalteromonas sp. S186]